jgi:hypothetical protein
VSFRALRNDTRTEPHRGPGDGMKQTKCALGNVRCPFAARKGTCSVTAVLLVTWRQNPREPERRVHMQSVSTACEGEAHAACSAHAALGGAGGAAILETLPHPGSYLGSSPGTAEHALRDAIKSANGRARDIAARKRAELMTHPLMTKETK